VGCSGVASEFICRSSNAHHQISDRRLFRATAATRTPHVAQRESDCDGRVHPNLDSKMAIAARAGNAYSLFLFFGGG